MQQDTSTSAVGNLAAYAGPGPGGIVWAPYWATGAKPYPTPRNILRATAAPYTYEIVPPRSGAKACWLYCWQGWAVAHQYTLKVPLPYAVPAHQQLAATLLRNHRACTVAAGELARLEAARQALVAGRPADTAAAGRQLAEIDTECARLRGILKAGGW